MSTDAAPVKKKPLLFKRSAGSFITPAVPPSTAGTVAVPPAHLHGDAAVDAGLNPVPVQSRLGEFGGGGGDHAANAVDLFRRSKTFFPRTIEEQMNSRRLQEGRGRKTGVAAATPSATTPSPERHDTKRRKLSHDSSSVNGDDGQGLPSQSRSQSQSPSPPPRSAADKGKAVATVHSVNEHLVFADAASTRDDNDTADMEASLLEIKADEEAPPDRGPRQDDGASVAPEVVALDDDDDGGDTANKHNNNINNDDDDDDQGIIESIDPEFQEYILRARARDAVARASQAVREATAVAAATSFVSSRSKGGDGGDGGDGNHGFGAGNSFSSAPETIGVSPSFLARDGSTPPLTSSQNYRIFVTAHFPQDVPPLLVMVRMDQQMKYVQTAFLEHAKAKGFQLGPEGEAAAVGGGGGAGGAGGAGGGAQPGIGEDSIVLTWKGSKLYSWTTGQSLGIHPDARGRFPRDEYSNAASSTGFMSGGLHLEIWTRPLYDAYLQEELRRRRRNLGEEEAIDADDLDDSDDGAVAGGNGLDHGPANAPGQSQGQGQQGGSGSGGDASNASAPTSSLRLILKSKTDKLGVTVHPETTVADLVAAFRQQHNIGGDRTVTLHWDGDQLDEGTTVADAEMENMDSVEVHIH